LTWQHLAMSKLDPPTSLDDIRKKGFGPRET